MFVSGAYNGIAADFLNFKNGLGPTKIYCMLVAKREYRFYEINFEQDPYEVQRAEKIAYITAAEGTIDFLIQTKQRKPV